MMWLNGGRCSKGVGEVVRGDELKEGSARERTSAKSAQDRRRCRSLAVVRSSSLFVCPARLNLREVEYAA